MNTYIIEVSSHQNGKYIGGNYTIIRLPIWLRFIKVYRLNVAYDTKYLRLPLDHEKNKGIGEKIFSFGESSGCIYITYLHTDSLIKLIKKCIHLFFKGVE